MPINIEEIEQLEKAETLGPWEYQEQNYRRGIAVKGGSVSDLHDSVASCSVNGDYADLKQENLEYIIAIHNSLPALLRELRAHRKFAETMKKLTSKSMRDATTLLARQQAGKGEQHTNEFWLAQQESFRTRVLDAALTQLEQEIQL